jgi:large subunit ribosomal protein L35
MPRNASKPKLKLKTHRGARKRFKITATGKIIRMHSGKRHLLGTKAAKRMRKLKKLTQVSKRDVPPSGRCCRTASNLLPVATRWASFCFFRGHADLTPLGGRLHFFRDRSFANAGSPAEAKPANLRVRKTCLAALHGCLPAVSLRTAEQPPSA